MTDVFLHFGVRLDFIFMNSYWRLLGKHMTVLSDLVPLGLEAYHILLFMDMNRKSTFNVFNTLYF